MYNPHSNITVLYFHNFVQKKKKKKKAHEKIEFNNSIQD